MNKLIFLFCILLSFSCITDKQQTNKIASVIKTEISNPINNGFNIKDKDYTVHFNIDNNSTTPNLLISIELHNGAYYISPNEKRDFKGKFYIDLGSYTYLDFKGSIIETPKSVNKSTPYPYTNGTANWIDVNTTYKQPLQIKSVKNFEVFGRLRFTIEPRCTLEEIPFAISYQNGMLKVTSPKC